MYITYFKTKQNNTNQILDYNSVLTQNVMPMLSETFKLTLKIDTPTPRDRLNQNMRTQIETTENIINYCETLLEPFKNNYNEQYYTFQIPKHSGGLRTIYAPNTAFKEVLTTVLNLLTDASKCLPHTAAYAYVKERSIKDANEQHQKNESQWFLHLDLQDFFPSCTSERIFNTLCELYPFYYITNAHKECLKNIIKICCLNDALPQGSPISPWLSNLVMVPIDYAIHNFCMRHNPFDNHFTYTRYADDFTISSKKNFDWQKFIEYITPLIQPFTIKESKTHYGNRAGSNWNLGLMLNKDNKITLGHLKKHTLNAILHNFLKDFANNNRWSKEDTYVLQGNLSFLKHIEPEYYNYIINKYEQKFNVSYKTAIKTIL